MCIYIYIYIQKERVEEGFEIPLSDYFHHHRDPIARQYAISPPDVVSAA